MHLVDWGVVCLHKEKGGLGVRNLAVMNKALLGKWVWRFAIKDNPAWKEVIRLKYQVQEGGWFTRDLWGSFSVGLWKDINREASVLKQDCFFVLGNGSRIKFWEDLWCRERV